jgi:hypothetical protein
MHESPCGTNRTSSDVRLESANRGKADAMCSERVFRLLTQSGHSRRLTEIALCERGVFATLIN